MSTLTDYAKRNDSPNGDGIVHLHGISWADYENVLQMRGDRSAPRLCYLDGELEIMSPSRDHESLKSKIGRMVEAYCFHAGIRFEAVGSWTLKDEPNLAGVEPDECYIFGDAYGDQPDLAIEVIWTSGGMSKLEIYRRLGVRELWYWRRGKLQAYGLGPNGYTPIDGSAVLPNTDLDLLASFLDRPKTCDAVLDFRAALES